MEPETFKHLRKNLLSLKQYELAKWLGVNTNTVGNYERGIIAVPRATALAMYWLVTHGPQEPDWFNSYWASEMANEANPS